MKTSAPEISRRRASTWEAASMDPSRRVSGRPRRGPCAPPIDYWAPHAERGAARRRHPVRSCWRGSGVLERVALFTVDHGVDAGQLVLVLDAEAHRLLDGPADDVRQDEGVDHHGEGTERLHPELLEAAAVEEAR